MPIRLRWTRPISTACCSVFLLLAMLVPAALLLPTASAQEPPSGSLLENLNRDFDAAAYVFLREVRALDGRLIFVRFRELWSTDATAGGTQRLCGPGGESECVEVDDFHPAPDGLVYFTDDQLRIRSRRLWRSDGTEAGTFPVTSPARTELALHVAGTRAFLHEPSGRLFFAAADDVLGTGRELWVSDGTVAGTRLVKDLHPGDRDSFPSFGATLGTGVVFAADASSADREPWITDGTADGTFRLADLEPGPFGSNPFGFATAGETVLFFTRPENGPFALQRTDGTPAGTREVVRFTGERALEDVFEVFSTPDGKVLFTALGSGVELWGSDGTVAGTRRLARLVGRDGEDETGFLAVGSRVVFFGASAEEGVEPWITDGTPEGTRLLADVCPGPCSSVVEGPWQAGEEAALALEDGGPRGVELWLTDGTSGGTRRVTDLCPGPCDGAPEVIDGEQGFLWLRGNDGEGDELWRFALGNNELQRLTDLEPENPILARLGGGLVDGVLVAPAADPIRGQSLWRSDGTLAGTEPYFLLEGPIDQGSNPRGFRSLSGEVFFTVDSPEPGLWASDGTAVGTRLAWPAPNGVVLLRSLAVLGDLLVFTAIRDEGEVDLYASDGTAAGTRPLAFDVDRREPPGGLPGLDPELHAAGGLAYLVSILGEPGLWVTDGTPDGTRRLAELTLANPSGAGVADRFFFTASTRDDSPLDLWVSDGTPEGTRSLTDFQPLDGFLPFTPGFFTLDPEELTAMGKRLFFTAFDGDRRVLWESDGTPGGTRPVVATPGGPLQALGLTAVGRRLFFFARQAGEGALETGLWVLDGAGPRRLATLQGFSGVDLLGTFVFLRTSSTGISRLWRSDGTAAGTRPVTALPPGTEPQRLHTVAGRLLVTTRSANQPAELWLVAPDLESTERVGTFSTELALTDFVRQGRNVLHSAFQREIGLEPWVFELPVCSPERPDLCPRSRRLGSSP